MAKKINEVWTHKPKGQKTYYVFGRKGSGKNKIKRVKYFSTKTKAMNFIRKFKKNK